MNIVIYHANCSDGFTAAWVTRRFLGEENTRFIPASYGTLPEIDVTEHDVYIVDFSYPREVLVSLNNDANSLLVLDHHKTAEAALEGLGFCQFDMARSGAGMAWDHFFPDTPRPWLVNYVEDRDIWKFEHPDSKLVSDYIMSQAQSFERWDEMAEMPLADAVSTGRVIRNVIEDYISIAAQQAREIRRLKGFPHAVGYVVNATYWRASDLLNHLAKKPIPEGPHEGRWPDFAIAYFEKASGDFQCSIRSCDHPDGRLAFDVSEIAASFGGGGHHRASGFSVSRLPWESAH